MPRASGHLDFHQLGVAHRQEGRHSPFRFLSLVHPRVFAASLLLP